MDLREVTEFLKDSFGYIITFLIIIVFVTFIASPQPVAGNSMSPTLEEGDVSLVSRFIYKFKTIERNEIVVLKVDKKSFVKRIVGLPGEEVHYLNNILYVNGTAYKEEFLDDTVKTNNFLFEDICSQEDCPDGVIPEDMYLVLGDNRPESLDSRDNSFGLVKKEDIKGKVIFRIWPLNKLGGIK